jgi:large subunit ribosomal protein L17
MRHAKDTCKLGRTGSHRRCMFANMLKSLVVHGRINTTVAKAKVLKRHADHIITLAKENSLSSRRQAIAKMMIRYNTLTPKEKRLVKEKNDISCYNHDRQVISKLFGELRERFADRNGGYTRIIKSDCRVGDGAYKCFIEYIS